MKILLQCLSLFFLVGVFVILAKFVFVNTKPVLPSVIPIPIPKDLIDESATESFRRILSGESGESVVPVRLRIPKINLDSVVEYAGITFDGSMDIPKDPAHVAWFSLGPRPGDVGSAVISGHYGWKDGVPAVFDNLHLLQKGDELYVENEKGEAVAFVVREIRKYDPDADAADVFISKDRKAHLNLITCEGIWDSTTRSYSKRLVVFTDLE